MNAVSGRLGDGRSFVWRIFLVGLALRLIPVLLAYNLSIGLDDMFQYDMLARSLAAGAGFRWYAQNDLSLIEQYVHLDLSNVDYDPRGVLTTFRAPLYPAFLAGIYLLFGAGVHRFFAARLAQAFLGALLPVLTYLVARRWFPEDERAARLSAGVIAFYPMLLLYPLALATENLFFVLVLAGLLVLLVAVERPTPGGFAAAGVLFGLAALTRSIILLAVGMAAVWLWFSLRRRRETVILCLALGATITPWVVRNSLLSGRLTGIETSLGYNLYLGYHPQSDGTFAYGPSLDLLSILDDSTRDQVGTQRAVAFVRQDPLRVPEYTLYRLGYFFGLESRAMIYFYSNDLLGYVSTPALLAAAFVLLIPFVAVSVSAALGLVIAPSGPASRVIVLLALGYLLPNILILAEDRFHLVLVPLLAILAARVWARGFPALRAAWAASARGRLILLTSGVMIALLFLNWGLGLYRDSGKIALLLGPNGNQTYFAY